jgi:hypothetical protein
MARVVVVIKKAFSGQIIANIPVEMLFLMSHKRLENNAMLMFLNLQSA